MGNDKKDLTGILDLQRLQAEDPSAVAENTEQDPFAVNELQPIEQVDDFASLDQIGMMDHPTEESTSSEAGFSVEQPARNEDPFAVNAESAPIADLQADPDFEVNTEHSSEPEFPLNTEESAGSLDFSSNETSASASFETSTSLPTNAPEAMNAAPDPFTPMDFADHSTESSSVAPIPAIESSASLTAVRNYSEKTSASIGSHPKIFYPFHLRIHGTFGPFERDKLLLFISENPIGLSTTELDLQLDSGKVFFPRISEFSAIKLIQELRDSELSFQIHPSDQDEMIAIKESPRTYRYQNPATLPHGDLEQEIPILNAELKPDSPYQEIEEISVTQFVRTDLVEVENSPIIQEVMERMTEALKQKARLKGGNALMHLQKEITPLRLPSQYQISLKANVIRLP
jgi:hypothetical protein